MPRGDAPGMRHALHGAWRRLREWLPQGNLLHPRVFAVRHRMITRLALVQALLLGCYGVLLDHDLGSACTAVLVAGLPALGGMLTSLPGRVRMLSVVTSLMFASASLVDLTHGVTEAHFHFFVMLGVVSLYQDWSAFGLCVLITVAHHALMGLTAPGTVFATAAQRSHPVQWALIHGGFILAASITHIVAWRFTEQLERRDPLTQLPNRAAFADRVEQALTQRRGAAVSVLYVDLDNFKAINDSGGHHVGDLALTHVATVMADNLRPNDVIARLGGDEFAVLVLGDATLAERLAARILTSLQLPFTADGRELLVTASIGVADTELTASRMSADLLRGADLAMYCAKSSGRNKLVRYSAEVDVAVRERAALAADLQHALERNELDVYYQPVVFGDPARVCGVEALARWHHPQHGLVPPDAFIPLAEESGLIKMIGAFVFRVAAIQVAAWHRELPGCADLQLAVNLSPVQLRDPSLVTMIGDTLHHSGLAPGHLIVEVTESMLLSDLDLARRQLDALRKLGAQVAIDDFGTGYSSLSYLAKLPADQVKIDKSFVQDLTREKSPSVALVRSIIDMANALGMDVQAEGVEVTEQREILSGLGCSRAQGFLYSRPLPSADFAQFTSTTVRVFPDGRIRRQRTRPRTRRRGLVSQAGASFVAVHRGHFLLFLAWLVCFAAAYLWNRRRSGVARRAAPRRGALLWATALTSGAGGAVHVCVIREHFAESAWYGWFFLALAAGQLGWSAVLLWRPSRQMLLAGAAASAAVVLLWLATRTVGIPLGPAAGEVEPVGVLDVLASLAEGATVLCALASLRAVRPASTSLAAGDVAACRRRGRARTGARPRRGDVDGEVERELGGVEVDGAVDVDGAVEECDVLGALLVGACCSTVAMSSTPSGWPNALPGAWPDPTARRRRWARRAARRWSCAWRRCAVCATGGWTVCCRPAPAPGTASRCRWRGRSRPWSGWRARSVPRRRRPARSAACGASACPGQAHRAGAPSARTEAPAAAAAGSMPVGASAKPAATGTASGTSGMAREPSLRNARATSSADGRSRGSVSVIAYSNPGHGSGSPAGIGGRCESRARAASSGGPSKTLRAVSASSSTSPRE